MPSANTLPELSAISQQDRKTVYRAYVGRNSSDNGKNQKGVNK